MNQKGQALLIVLLIAAAIGGYFFYSGKINLNKTSSTPVKITQPSPSDETANWKTYNGANFSFQYPSTLKEISHCRGQDSGPCFESPDFDGTQGDFMGGTNKGIVLTINNITNSNLNDQVFQIQCKEKNSYYPGSCFKDSINGKDTLHIQAGIKNGDRLNVTNELVYIQIKPNQILTIGFFNSSNNTTTERAIFQKILSPFKFQ